MAKAWFWTADYLPVLPRRQIRSAGTINEKEQSAMRCYRNLLGVVLLAMLAFWVAAFPHPAASQPEVLVIDATAPAHPFPHFWEHMFGSGRASLSMRESYRQELRQVKRVPDVQYIR